MDADGALLPSSQSVTHGADHPLDTHMVTYIDKPFDITKELDPTHIAWRDTYDPHLNTTKKKFFRPGSAGILHHRWSCWRLPCSWWG